MPYGEHTIKIAHVQGTYEISKIEYLPTLRAKRIEVSDFTTSSSWTPQTDNAGSQRIYTDINGNSLTKSVTLSKFWVYGTKCKWHKQMKIKFGSIEETVNTTEDYTNSDDYKTRRDNVLLYESETLPLSTNNIIITAVGGTITLCNFYYLDEPEVPPISVPVTQMDVSGEFGSEYTQCYDDYTHPTCGYRYWSHSTNKNLNFSLRFMGEKFIVVGTNDPSHGKYQIYLDGEFYAEVDQYRAIDGCEFINCGNGHDQRIIMHESPKSSLYIKFSTFKC